MTENNTNININEDIYKIFYSTLLIEIKKIIKKFQWRKSTRKYKENNKYRYTELNKLSKKKYYYDTPGLREKILHYRKLRYQIDENFRNKSNAARLNHYYSNKEETLKKAKIRYQLMKNKKTQKMETNDNSISSH